MTINSNSLAIIPARGGSKSIKNKNVKLFDGKPLIAWTIEQAIASNVTRVVVTTDCKNIREIAIKYGAEVPYLRSAKLSGDTIGIEPVIIDVKCFSLKSAVKFFRNSLVIFALFVIMNSYCVFLKLSVAVMAVINSSYFASFNQ